MALQDAVQEITMNSIRDTSLSHRTVKATRKKNKFYFFIVIFTVKSVYRERFFGRDHKISYADLHTLGYLFISADPDPFLETDPGCKTLWEIHINM